jgi:hypothetical protein
MMTQALLAKLIFIAGLVQFSILIASAMVPIRLNWREELKSLSRLHRQMYWTYGGYIVLSIVAFGCISITNAAELARRSPLARGFCLYVFVFWAVRVALQAVFDVKEHLTAWWLRAGEVALTLLFAYLATIFGWAAMGVVH